MANAPTPADPHACYIATRAALAPGLRDEPPIPDHLPDAVRVVMA